MVVYEFSSMERFFARNESIEYTRWKDLRQSCCDVNAILYKGKLFMPTDHAVLRHSNLPNLVSRPQQDAIPGKDSV